MGAWSESIMGGDTPLDIRAAFEEKFGGEEDNILREEDGEPPLPIVVPTTAASTAFMNDMLEEDYDQEPQFGIVLGFLLMERGAPVNQAIRDLVAKSLAEELSDEAINDWGDGDARRKVLEDFRDQFAAYPDEGAKVEMPEQPGLMETIFNGIASRET